MVSLILSDVIGDDLDSIASGPTVPDPSTFSDCMEIVRKYRILEDLPGSVKALLKRGIEGAVPETPKPGDPVFARTQNAIIGNNLLAVSTAETRARELGYHALVLSTMIEGETRDVALVHAAIAKEIRKSGRPLAVPACVISGGETTVTIRGEGVGGRNQEFALAAALEMDGWSDMVILSGGTDGTDGPTDAAGAVADGTTVQKARAAGLEAKDYLRNNDSYNFFKPIRGLLITGPTLTNVMDLRLVLVR
jgi:hydroxypyruvate reductase